MKKLALKLEGCNEKITPFGGIVLIKDLINHLGIKEHIDNYLPKPGSNAGKLPSSKVIPALISMILGGSGFSDIDKISKDEVIKAICGLDTVCDSTTINRFYNRYGASSGDIACGAAIEEMGNLMFNVAFKGLRREGIKEVTVDQDATYIAADKYDANMTYKGFYGFSSLTCFIDDYGYCVDEEFRNGNVSPASGILSQLERVHRKLTSHGIRLKRLRSDSAGYQGAVINYCMDNGIEFFIGADKDKAVMESIAHIGSNDFKPYYDRYGVLIDTEEAAEFIHCMNHTHGSFRMIVLRKTIKEEKDTVAGLLGLHYDYHVIATNSNLPVEEVVHIYKGRGRCEYYIKRAKYDFDLRHLPSGELGGNGLWFKTGMVAYNMMVYFLRNILKGNYVTREMKSIRYLILSIGAKLVYHGRQLILRLCCSKDMLYSMMRWRKLCEAV